MSERTSADNYIPVKEYDELWKTRNVPTHATHLLPHIRPNSRILDVGCGVGAITIDMARQAPEGFVLGIDHDEGSITKARSDARTLGITNIEFKVGSAEDMTSLETESFDIAHAHQVLIHLADPVSTLKQVHRILRPGGIVSSRDATYLTFYPIFSSALENWSTAWQFHWNKTKKAEAGLINHVWVHDAGFAWESIETGSASWGWSGLKQRRAMAEAAVTSAEKRAEASDLNEFIKDIRAWAERPDAKMVAMDGWVIARK